MLILEPGAKIEAVPGAFQDVRDAMFPATKVSNLTIAGGPGAEIAMRKQDYLDPEKYATSEWQHAIALLSCRNVTIRDLKISASGGDGIYVGVLAEKGNRENYCRDIVMERVDCDDHNRQGISVISVDGLTIRDSVFRNTQGARPMAGIDFEPNNRTKRLENCRLENCLFENNAGGGIDIAINVDRPIDITFRNCTVVGPQRGIVFAKLRNFVTPGQVTFHDTTITGTANDAINVINHDAESYAIAFHGLIIAGDPKAAACITMLPAYTSYGHFVSGHKSPGLKKRCEGKKRERRGVFFGVLVEMTLACPYSVVSSVVTRNRSPIDNGGRRAKVAHQTLRRSSVDSSIAQFSMG